MIAPFARAPAAAGFPSVLCRLARRCSMVKFLELSPPLTEVAGVFSRLFPQQAESRRRRGSAGDPPTLRPSCLAALQAQLEFPDLAHRLAKAAGMETVARAQTMVCWAALCIGYHGRVAALLQLLACVLQTGHSSAARIKAGVTGLPIAMRLSVLAIAARTSASAFIPLHFGTGFREQVLQQIVLV